MNKPALPAEEDQHLLPVSLDLTPATYDIDYAGHVSNIVYIRWLEDLRLAWLDAYAPLSEMMEDGIGPVLLRTEIDYLRPIRLLNRPIQASLWVASFDKLRATMKAEFRYNDQVMARAVQVGMFFKVESGRPVRVPQQILDQINLKQ